MSSVPVDRNVLVDRQEALRRMQVAMGELPSPARIVPPRMEVVEEVLEPALLRRRITFAVEPGDRDTAWLIMPRTLAAPQPAMLCLHQTTGIGKDEPAGLGGKPNLHYARELAQRGYVTLSPDYPNFGEYFRNVYDMGYASATMKGIWNHMRAVDLLSELPEVDPRRIGVIGHSLGGHNALFVAAFDERLKAVVTSCGFTRFTWSDNEGMGRMGDVSDWSHDGYMPRIRKEYGCRAEHMPFDFPDVLSAIAPRGVFINAALGDFFRYEGVDECVELLRPVYERAGVSERLVCDHPEGGHDFPPQVREHAYQWLDGMLRG